MTVAESAVVPPQKLRSSIKESSLGDAGFINGRWVYGFNEADMVRQERSYTADEMKALLGGKGANLVEMTRLGLPIPPGFTVTTEACRSFLKQGHVFPPDLWHQIREALTLLEVRSGKAFGDPRDPLLVSCRSGARYSMPGMMDTVLNIGLNDLIVQGLGERYQNERFAYDCYRRLIQMFSSVVLGVPSELYEQALVSEKKAAQVKDDADLGAREMRRIVDRFKAITECAYGAEFPQDPLEQLELAVRAVFKSWEGKRAVDYRNATKVSHDLGTAVTVQTVVFGNRDEMSGTGVAFSRNPVSGYKELYGDFVSNAQGEDVVAGIRNTEPLSAMRERFPAVYAQFEECIATLEDHYRDMQDVEFTIQEGKLWLLQTRTGKRTARAAVRIAVDMAQEGLITRDEAMLRIAPDQVHMLLHPQFSAAGKQEAIDQHSRIVAKAVNASPGAAVGVAVFDADTAERWSKEGRAVIMVRPETKPDDVHGMIASKGILTSRGGATSHAAVVARQFGVPAVCGAEVLDISVEHKRFTVDRGEVTLEVHEGDWLSIDGGSGEVFLGVIPTEEPNFEDEVELNAILHWADCRRTLGIWVNADYPKDAVRGRRYGAEGIGLCRTEHMFFEGDRLPTMQAMIMADSRSRRVAFLDELLPMQRSDFEGLFRAMDGCPVIIRLLDPPLHEFLPSHKALLLELGDLKIQLRNGGTLQQIDQILKELRRKEDVLGRVESLSESNPMLGLRGDRLAILMPEICQMQVRAIVEAAIRVQREGVKVHPEIMVPLVGTVGELRAVEQIVRETAAQVFREQGETISYLYGTMIEVPRAALIADELAITAEFISFGTNDLTQLTFGMSRDDAEAKFLMHYLESGILKENPFQTIDRTGVGRLVEMGVAGARRRRPDISCGICGEHGGDPSSIQFCHEQGLAYVSCSPFRVPVARLAAAQAAILADRRAALH